VVTTAIGLLLDADELAQANNLYRERLAEGRVFQWLVAPREGLASALGFVATSASRDHLQQVLSPSHLGFYLNEVSMSARMAGDFDLAERYSRETIDVDRQLSATVDLSADLRNRAYLLVGLGRLGEAEPVAREALDLARQADDDRGEREALAWLGIALGLQGQIAEALPPSTMPISSNADTKKASAYTAAAGPHGRNCYCGSARLSRLAS
jgi:hypothetical protein